MPICGFLSVIHILQIALLYDILTSKLHHQLLSNISITLKFLRFNSWVRSTHGTDTLQILTDNAVIIFKKLMINLMSLICAALLIY